MIVTLGILATGGYVLNWNTPSKTDTECVMRHEDHITDKNDYGPVAKAFGWCADMSMDYEDYLDMVTDDRQQDISNQIQHVDLPAPWCNTVERSAH